MASHPDFSKSYDLRAADEAAIREVFHAGVLEYFEARPGLTVKAKDGRLVLFRSKRTVKPEDMGTLLAEGLEVLHLFVLNH